MPDGPPGEVEALAAARAKARSSRDFARADELRDEIAAAGWVVADGPDGWSLSAKPPWPVFASVSDLPDRATESDTHPATASIIVDGWAQDAVVCIEALLAHGPSDLRIQLLELGDVDGGAAITAALASDRVEILHVERASTWHDARLALLRADTAAIHIWLDPSSVLTGDAISPLLEALTVDTVVGAGWRGVDIDVADNWRSAQDATGDVDALLGYLFAFRRSAGLAAGLPKAKFYRNADIEFSFQLRESERAAGRAGRLVVPSAGLPVEQRRHHGYHDSDPTVRDRESAKTWQRFLGRFRGREDLLARNSTN